MQDTEKFVGTTDYTDVQKDFNGISSIEVDNLMTTLLDYAELSNRILNQIDDLVAETTSYFSCESGDKFRDQYNMLKTGNAIINKNILSYNTDLMNVKSNYQNRVDVSTDIINTGINSINDKM